MNWRLSLLCGFVTFLLFPFGGKLLRPDEIDPDEGEDRPEITLIAREGSLLTGKAVCITPGPIVRPIYLYPGDTLQVNPYHPFVFATCRGTRLKVELTTPATEDEDSCAPVSPSLEMLHESKSVVDWNGHSTQAAFFHASRPGITRIVIKMISDDPHFLPDPGLCYHVKVDPLK